MDSVSVNSQFSGQGYGTALLQDAISDAKEKSYSTVSLDLEEINENARKLYERLGFPIKKRLALITIRIIKW